MFEGRISSYRELTRRVEERRLTLLSAVWILYIGVTGVVVLTRSNGSVPFGVQPLVAHTYAVGVFTPLVLLLLIGSAVIALLAIPEAYEAWSGDSSLSLAGELVVGLSILHLLLLIGTGVMRYAPLSSRNREIIGAYVLVWGELEIIFLAVVSVSYVLLSVVDTSVIPSRTRVRSLGRTAAYSVVVGAFLFVMLVFLTGGHVGYITPGVHDHGEIQVVVDGEEVDFSQQHLRDLNPSFHFHDSPDIWHNHAGGITLAYALSALGIHVVGDQAWYDGTTYSDVDIRVNDERVDPGSHVLDDGDRIHVELA